MEFVCTKSTPLLRFDHFDSNILYSLCSTKSHQKFLVVECVNWCKLFYIQLHRKLKFLLGNPIVLFYQRRMILLENKMYNILPKNLYGTNYLTGGSCIIIHDIYLETDTFDSHFRSPPFLVVLPILHNTHYSHQHTTLPQEQKASL